MGCCSSNQSSKNKLPTRRASQLVLATTSREKLKAVEPWDAWLSIEFRAVDVGKRGHVTVEEAYSIAVNLHVSMSFDEFRAYYDEAETTSDGGMTQAMFAKFYERIQPQPTAELSFVFSKYSDTNRFLSPAELRHFRQNCQMESNVTEEATMMLIQRIHALSIGRGRRELDRAATSPASAGSGAGAGAGGTSTVNVLHTAMDAAAERRRRSEASPSSPRGGEMSKRRASVLRLSASNDILNLTDFFLYLTDTQSNGVFEPAHRRSKPLPKPSPLFNYQVLGSYRSALTSTPTGGLVCSAEAVKRVLMLGVRSLHFDVYDGSALTSGPVVATSRALGDAVPFRDVALALKEFAFRPTNPQPSGYPVIIRLTNCCSPPFQEQLANILAEVLGSSLSSALPGAYVGSLPSVSDLQRKFLLRVDGYEPNETNPELDPLHPALRRLVVTRERDRGALREDQGSFCSVAPFDTLMSDSSAIPTSTAMMHFISSTPSSPTANSPPEAAWARGVNDVGLLMHVHDPPLWRALGHFRSNGGVGFMPMAAPTSTPLPAFNLAVNVVTGHSLGGASTVTSGSATAARVSTRSRNPYVEVHCFNGQEGSEMVVKKTAVVAGNALNPKWNYRAVFPVADARYAQIGFVVRDAAHSDAVLGQYFLDVPAMRLGFRVVPLHDAAGFALVDGFLFIGITKEPA